MHSAENWLRMGTMQWSVKWFRVECQNITKAEYNHIKGGLKIESSSKMHWYCPTYDNMAVNFMKTMTNLHKKQQKMEERMSKQEEKINQEGDKGEDE